MTRIIIKKKNEVFLQIQAEPYVHQELSDYFTFEVPEAKFLKRNPRFKYWDGTIRLYSPGTGEIYVGLYQQFLLWAKERGYSIESVKNDWYGEATDTNSMVSPEGVKSFMDKSPASKLETINIILCILLLNIIEDCSCLPLDQVNP